MFFSIKTKDRDTVAKILKKESAIEFSGLNVLQDRLHVGQVVFIVLGGDHPSWDTGLVGIGVISQAPYDLNYEGRNYRIKVDIRLLLDKAIKRGDLVAYKDAFGIIGIGPITTWEPNQALSQIEEYKAITLMRAMLDIDPKIEPDLVRLINPSQMQKIKGPTTKYIEVNVRYGQRPDEIASYTHNNKTEDIVSDTSVEYIANQKYSKDDFLSEVFMEETQYDAIVKLLARKKNIILQGAPGVGKTFAAKRLAYSILGCKDDSKIEFVQFHQSYAYEDFVCGYKPTETGFVIEKGPFYKFCKKAQADRDNKYFFIIDEINRGNLSRIFGELLMLIEASKRNESATLLYTKESFNVPDNVYIIGMMNTADRSLAMIDYALRRRFSFFPMEPAFGLKSFKEYLNTKSASKVNLLVAKIVDLNNEIESDDNLGKGFKIGHSYLCTDDLSDDALNAIVQYEIIPLLEEYWYDEPSKVDKWKQELDATLKQ